MLNILYMYLIIYKVPELILQYSHCHYYTTTSTITVVDCD